MSAPATQHSHGSAASAAALRRQLLRLWDRAGRPSTEELARATGEPVSLFAGLFVGLSGSSDKEFPSWDEIKALLDAVSENDPAMVASCRQRWQQLNPPTKLDVVLLHKDTLDVEVLVETKHVTRGAETRVERAPVPVAGPLSKALRAATPAEFNAQLRQLMIDKKMSYSAVAAKCGSYLPRSTAHLMTTRDRLPARSEQVRYFVKACGASSTEVTLWERAWAGVRARQARAATKIDATEPENDASEPPTNEATPERRAGTGRVERPLLTVHFTITLEGLLRAIPMVAAFAMAALFVQSVVALLARQHSSVLDVVAVVFIGMCTVQLLHRNWYRRWHRFRSRRHARRAAGNGSSVKRNRTRRPPVIRWLS